MLTNKKKEENVETNTFTSGKALFYHLTIFVTKSLNSILKGYLSLDLTPKFSMIDAKVQRQSTNNLSLKIAFMSPNFCDKTVLNHHQKWAH